MLLRAAPLLAGCDHKSTKRDSDEQVTKKVPVKPRVFLCHASEDKDTVRDVYRVLVREGYDPWLDEEDLLPGQFWEEEIPNAIRLSDYVLIFFSTVSVTKRGYVQKEFRLALDVLDEIPEGQIFMIPVRVDDCEIPRKFRHLQWCDLFRPDGSRRLVQTLRQDLARREIATPVILRSAPNEDFSLQEIMETVKQYDFFVSLAWGSQYVNPEGKGIDHFYRKLERFGVVLVFDYGTNLTWQQSGSEDRLTPEAADAYVAELNVKRHGGYDDWRLPTIDEALSLLEDVEPPPSDYPYRPGPKENFFDPVFDNKQFMIFTSDRGRFNNKVSRLPREPFHGYWRVDMLHGSFLEPWEPEEDNYVRAVRSGIDVPWFPA
jgi:TIR domain/Protein of unknown function (DUF1566)